MKRRQFMALAAAATLVPAQLLAGNVTLDYEPGVLKKQLAAGKTVLVDYYASWCSTCKAQDRAIESLRRSDPAYDKNIVFIKVDWDFYSGEPIARKYKIPRRSTLVLLKGDKELGRIVAGTTKNEIKALLRRGLPTS